MDNIDNIFINGKSIAKASYNSFNFIKIVKSDQMIMNYLFLSINKKLYKNPLPTNNSTLEIKFATYGRSTKFQNLFYLYEENDLSDTKHLNETEKALLKDPNNLFLYGLSVNQEFLNKYNVMVEAITKNKPHCFQNLSLNDILTHISKGLNIKSLLVQHTNADKKIKCFIPNKIHKNQHGQYNKSSLEDLAEIFYAVINVTDEVLLFLEKGTPTSKSKINHTLDMMKITKIDYINKKDPIEYKSVKCKYWKNNTNNIISEIIVGHEEPCLKLDKVYEKDLASIYAFSKIAESKEQKQVKLTLNGVHDKIPGASLIASSNNYNKITDAKLLDLKGFWSVKECIMTYGRHIQNDKDLNTAGPSSKKPKLEPTWNTTLVLVNVGNTKSNKKQ